MDLGGNAKQLVVWHGVRAVPCGAVVSPWLVWTARTVGRASGATVGLRRLYGTQQLLKVLL